MKYIFTILSLFSFFITRSQNENSDDSVSIYISRLDWNSFAIGSTYAPQFGLYEDANQLIKIKDKSKIKRLVENIKDSQKTVVIHMILSRLIEPKKIAFGEIVNYGENSAIKSVTFSFNGLTWTGDFMRKFNNISQDEIDRIDQYWRRRCHIH